MFGICQALTLNISSEQSKEKLTMGPNCSPLKFDLVSANFGVGGFCRWSLPCILGDSAPHFAKFQPGDLSNRLHNFTAQKNDLE